MSKINKSVDSAKTRRSTALRRAALAYAGMGLPVLPMYSGGGAGCSCHDGGDCRKPGKHPATAKGVHDATTKRRQVRDWWADESRANIGIAVGNSAGVIVIDIDPRNGGTETLKQLEAELGKLPDTLTSETGGGGKHLVFKYPDFRVRKDSAGKLLGSGVDVLSDSSIMVAPPSKHASGRRYVWADGRSPQDLSPAPLPEAWLARLGQAAKVVASEHDDGIVREGGRNGALTSVAGGLRRAGLSVDAIRAALLAENRARCSPPLEDSEVEKIAKNVARYPASPAGERSDDAEKLMTIVLSQHFEDGQHLMFGADGHFWHYSGKVWSRAQEKWIEGRILDTIQVSAIRTGQGSASLMSQVRKLMEAKLSKEGDPLRFRADPAQVINCANGELWIAGDGSLDLRPHRPESYLTHFVDVAYDPAAKCPKYDSALLDIFANAKRPKILRRHWNELVGYLIQPRRNIPLIVILLGAGANGKTVLARTIVRLMGQAQVHAQRVEELDKNRFAMGSLLGKLLFLDDDVRAGARLPDGILKTISEAKEVTGENKYKPSFNFTVRTVPMLLCNNVPSLADVSYGMLRRLMVFPFDRTFTEEEKDTGLFERIWADEMPGLLNRALQGYARLIKRRRFKYPRSVAQCTARWLEQANPVPAFIDECCIKKVDAKCLTKDLYPAYKKWATEAGYTLVQNQLTFRRNLEHLGFACVRGNGGYQAMKGLVLKP